MTRPSASDITDDQLDAHGLRWDVQAYLRAAEAGEALRRSADAARDLRDRITEAAMSVQLRLGPHALAVAQAGMPIRLSGGEADGLADAVLAIVQPELDRLRRDLTDSETLRAVEAATTDRARAAARRYTRMVRAEQAAGTEELPGRVLAEIHPHLLRAYVSTACDTARACWRAELWNQAAALHQRCRKVHKFTGERCACRCHDTEDPQ